MATFHEMTGGDGAPVVRCYVKGAPDVLIAAGGSYRDPDGTVRAGSPTRTGVWPWRPTTAWPAPASA